MDSAQLQCPYCQKGIEPAEEHVIGHCNKPGCGASHYHNDCAETIILDNPFDSGSHVRKLKGQISKHPHRLFKRVPCQRPGCDGYVIDSEIGKPTRAAMAPAVPTPQSQPKPARPVKPAKPAKPPNGGGGGHQAAAERQPLAQRPQQQGQAEFLGLGGGSLKPPKPASHSSDPQFLVLCPDWAASGRCFAFKCAAAHSEKELEERRVVVEIEKEKAALKARQREEKRRAKERRREQEAAVAAAPAPAVAPATGRPTPDTGALGPVAVELLRTFKRGHAVSSLLDMGFSMSAAQAAVAATGADVMAAAMLLGEGRAPEGSTEVDVSKEIDELLACALGLDATAIEGEVIANSGDCEAANAPTPQRADPPAGQGAAMQAHLLVPSSVQGEQQQSYAAQVEYDPSSKLSADAAAQAAEQAELAEYLAMLGIA